MAHLAPRELVDFLDGRLVVERARHVETCRACRQQVDELRVTMRAAREVEAPEPSPLFWEHFSGRVRQAIAAEPAPSGGRWLPGWSLGRMGIALAGATIAIVLLAGAVVWRTPVSPAKQGETSVATGLTGDEEAVLDPGAALADEPEWAFVVTVAQEMDWDEVTEAGLGVRPGAAERAVLELSADERRELGRLLKAELERAKL